MPISFILLGALFFSGMSDAPKVVDHPGFDVVGMVARTNNAREMSAGGVIGKQWAWFFQEGLLQKIPDRADQTIYALYSDYQKDRNGDYDFVIGARVKAGAPVPAGMVLKHVPAGKYAVITSGKGPGFQVVPAAWQRVWQLEDRSGLGGQRAYATDFEVYDERARDPQAAVVDLYVGIR